MAEAISNPQTSTSTSQNIQSAEADAKLAEWESKILNLNTNNEDLMKIINQEFGDSGTEAGRLMVSTLLQQRTSMINMLSNLIKTIFEGTRSVIHNMRV